MKTIAQYFCSLIATLVLFFVFNVSGASAATLYFSPSSGDISVGNILTTSVLVNTQGQAINNADAVINFPANLLEVVSVSRSGSIFSLWVEEPAFSNSAGTITFNGGLPTPGFNGTSGRIISIVFRAKSTGLASVIFSSAAVRANDGHGTDILQTSTQALFNLLVVEAPPEVPEPEPTPQPTPTTIPQPNITSITHPVEGAWFARSGAQFSWSVPSGVDAVRLLVGSLPQAIPTVVYEPPINSRDIDDLPDGVWYFHAQFRSGGTWGPVRTYEFRIDTQPPHQFDANLLERDDLTSPTIAFRLSAEDEQSGIAKIEILLNGDHFEDIAYEGEGIYTTSPLPPGEHTLGVRAVDHAGNFIERTFSVDIAAPDQWWLPLTSLPYQRIALWIVGLLALLLLGIAVRAIWRTRPKILAGRTKSAKTANHGVHTVFDELRDEVRETVDGISWARSKKKLAQQKEHAARTLRKKIDAAEKAVQEKLRGQ